MDSPTLRLSVVQIQPGSDKAANIRQAEQQMEAVIRRERPRMVALPEMWSCLGGDRATKFAAGEVLPVAGSESAGGEAYQFLRDMARRHDVFVHGGSIGEQAESSDGPRLFNTTVVFAPDGTERARYRKIHLFDIQAPDGTGYRESATYGAGRDLVLCDIDDLRVGLAICYDLRFPELFRALREAGAELIMLPSAFTVPTGRDHWEVLIRARAIETQCFLAAPATDGVHIDAAGRPRATYGHSLICDPWGRVLAGLGEGVGSATADLDSALLDRIRRDMPILKHRVPSIQHPQPERPQR